MTGGGGGGWCRGLASPAAAGGGAAFCFLILWDSLVNPSGGGRGPWRWSSGFEEWREGLADMSAAAVAAIGGGWRAGNGIEKLLVVYR